MNTRRVRAFTLIELLVVIAIIAILVSILMPSLAKAKQYARLASCMSNLHNIGVGIMIYTEEYNGCWPVRPSQTPGRAPAVEMLKVQELDDRPLYKGILPMDLFGCPLSKPQTFSYGSTPADFVFSTYEMYFGHTIDFSQPQSGLTGNSRRSYTYNGKTFRVMLADWERLTPSWDAWLTAHPDAPATLKFEEYSNASMYGATYSWTGWGGLGPQHGAMDRNFLFTDCSLRTLRGLKTTSNPLSSDTRTVMMPAVSENSSQNCFLPPD